MLNEAQYDYVKGLLVERMSKYRRNSFRLDRLYNIIHEQTNSESYVTFTYDDFYKMFQAECVSGKIPYRKFSISEEGFLDKKKKYPYANVSVEVLKKVKS